MFTVQLETDRERRRRGECEGTRRTDSRIVIEQDSTIGNRASGGLARREEGRGCQRVKSAILLPRLIARAENRTKNVELRRLSAGVCTLDPTLRGIRSSCHDRGHRSTRMARVSLTDRFLDTIYRSRSNTLRLLSDLLRQETENCAEHHPLSRCKFKLSNRV